MEQREQQSGEGENRSTQLNNGQSVPSITLPKGGGAIHGMGEKLGANPVTGTGSMSVPIATSPGRSGFGPQLSLAYDSGSGNGPFGFGWNSSVPSITRRTDKGLPQYCDTEESDIFILSGAEDLVSVLIKRDGKWVRQTDDSPASEPGYEVRRYRPRIEGLFARIERWTDKTTGISHWRSISRDNVTTLYGKREDARIADPNDPTRVFSWLIFESHDDKGNAVIYRYKTEDDAHIDRKSPEERNRLIAGQFSQRYLKNICYGNRTPRVIHEDLSLRKDWLFEVVFDYGEHDDTDPTTRETRPWPIRKDPFSQFRSTFEIRTYRLCRRVLMFHHFREELDGTIDYLVRSTDFCYHEGSVASFIRSVIQSGYTQQTDKHYLRKSLPKLEFQYTSVKVNETVREVDADSHQNLPYGADGSQYQWIDLDSEGLTGVLTEQDDAWYYKRNLGNGTFGPVEQVAMKSSLTALSSGQQQLLDLAGEGHLELVQFEGPMAGFHERKPQGGWKGFTPFKHVPNVDTKDPNLRFVDVTGDGFSDIVRIRHSEVCYWPNLGYGRFGAKVTMGNAPVFESQDLFDPRRIRLADIDGSGNTDFVMKRVYATERM